MSKQSPASLLMDVQPWQHSGNRPKVGPFNCVGTGGVGGFEWSTAQERGGPSLTDEEVGVFFPLPHLKNKNTKSNFNMDFEVNQF